MAVSAWPIPLAIATGNGIAGIGHVVRSGFAEHYN